MATSTASQFTMLWNFLPCQWPLCDIQQVCVRSIGLWCVMYIDVEICGASSEQKCRSDTSAIVSDLEQAGFVLNVNKSRPKSEQVAVWLGFTLDLRERKFWFLKIKSSEVCEVNWWHPNFFSIQCNASAVGKSFLLGRLLAFTVHTRALYAVINSHWSWADRLLLSKDPQEQFWKSCLSYFNGTAYLVLTLGYTSSILWCKLFQVWRSPQSWSQARGGAWAMVRIWSLT